jgi:hypothetical protein
MSKPSSTARGNPSRRMLAEVVADGVVAAYIHAISVRHDGPAAEDEQPQRSTWGEAFDLD